MSERMDQEDDFLDDLQNYHKTNKKMGKTLEDMLQTKEDLSNTYANYGRYDARNHALHELVNKYGNRLAENLSEEKEDRKNFFGLLSSDDEDELSEQLESYEKRINFFHDVVDFVVDTDDEKIQELYDDQQGLTKNLTKLEGKKWKLKEDIQRSLNSGAMNVEEEQVTICGKVYKF